jgi:hypothetical protein
MRSPLFWNISRCRVVIVYRRFGTRIGPIFKGQEVQEEKKVSKPKHIVSGEGEGGDW